MKANPKGRHRRLVDDPKADVGHRSTASASWDRDEIGLDRRRDRHHRDRDRNGREAEPERQVTAATSRDPNSAWDREGKPLGGHVREEAPQPGFLFERVTDKRAVADELRGDQDVGDISHDWDARPSQRRQSKRPAGDDDVMDEQRHGGGRRGEERVAWRRHRDQPFPVRGGSEAQRGAGR
ncbi:hypothetical protein OM076_43310 [Solirubrobacter ginsenosidimutans]|uniref:Uncharacterized protein n=1 Tax=Solirubrobacter ginsenosidimutans TaxID=490573 RepID=A0A9X3N960_9ACTN|nr:hypothetical protein [Solirubrobacter ginsenosidimutans]MDA0167168.1 hypothetical protein [Solirubrobacter ginsenosidimutans]